MTSPIYRVYIDWDSDDGLLLGSFESSLDGWDPAATGTTAPTITQSTTRAYHGSTSLLVTWSAGGSLQLVQPDPKGTFVSGREYTFSAWVYVPSSGGRHVLCAVDGGSTGTASSTTNQWVQISLTFTATSATHQLQIRASGTPSSGDLTWIDHVRVIGPGEELTASDPGVISNVDIDYGRDQARSLQPVSPGSADFVVDNVDRDYSPENTSSPLAGLLGPGRRLVIEATYDGKVYSLFDGATDDYQVDSSAGKWTAKFSAIDGLARLKNVPVSTALYPSVRTGEAIGYILDAIGWTGGRDLDPGGSTIRWWCAESDDAFQELMDLVETEGPDAFVFISPTGEFVFRDRHHRLIRDASTSVQATFRDGVVTSPDVEHDPPFVINFGWRDIVNMVEVSISERTPSGEAEAIWSDPRAYTLSAGQSRQFVITTDDPFYNLLSPTQDTPTNAPFTDPDFIVVGGTVSVTFTRMSGQSTTMTVTAVGATTNVHQMRLRAQPVKSDSNAVKIRKEDATSIALTRGVKPHKPTSKWLSANDADAIADIILGKRAQRLPVVEFNVVNGSADQLVQLLSRDLSDRIRIVDSESGVDAHFYIEHISHRISDDGDTHTTTFACEKIPTLPGNVFTFDLAGAGFNDGVFGTTGIDDPDLIFRFDVAGQGFNDGVFAT